MHARTHAREGGGGSERVKSERERQRVFLPLVQKRANEPAASTISDTGGSNHLGYGQTELGTARTHLPNLAKADEDRGADLGIRKSRVRHAYAKPDHEHSGVRT